MSAVTTDKTPAVVEAGQSHARIVWGQFKKNTPALLSLCGIVLLTLVAIGADLLAGDKPYYMQYQGNAYFPVFRQYGIYLGVMEWPAELRRRRNFKKLKIDQAVFPLVPTHPARFACGINTSLPAPSTGWAPTVWVATCFRA